MTTHTCKTWTANDVLFGHEFEPFWSVTDTHEVGLGVINANMLHEVRYLVNKATPARHARIGTPYPNHHPPPHTTTTHTHTHLPTPRAPGALANR